MQLVAYGAQDVYLTGSPKITFFSAQYRRHTNFSMETIEQTVNGTAANSGRVSVTVARNGDLVGEMYLELTTAANLSSATSAADVNWVAERAVSSAELSWADSASTVSTNAGGASTRKSTLTPPRSKTGRR